MPFASCLPVQADSGDIFWHGEKLAIANPAVARRLGIGMVYQHFSLFETVSVVENIAVAIEGAFVMPPVKRIQIFVGQARVKLLEGGTLRYLEMSMKDKSVGRILYQRPN